MSIWNQIAKRYIMCNIRMREREFIFIYSLTNRKKSSAQPGSEPGTSPRDPEIYRIIETESFC